MTVAVRNDVVSDGRVVGLIAQAGPFVVFPKVAKFLHMYIMDIVSNCHKWDTVWINAYIALSVLHESF